MQPISIRIRLGFVLLCVILGGVLLAITNYFFPKFIAVSGILVGGMIVSFVFYLPGVVSPMRDLLLLMTLILTDITAIILMKRFCFWRIDPSVCSPSSLRAAAFGDIFFPGIIVVPLWLSHRIRQFLSRWK